MDGENNGKPYEQMDDLGGFIPIFGNTHIYLRKNSWQREISLRDFPNLWTADLRQHRRHGSQAGEDPGLLMPKGFPWDERYIYLHER